MVLLLVLKHDLWAMGDESAWYMTDESGDSYLEAM